MPSEPIDQLPDNAESVSPRSEPQVWFLSGDLMFASRVRSAADRAGLEFRLAMNLPDEPTSEIRYVILDLSTRSSLTATLLESCERLCPNAKLIAYGPHVQIGRLKTAREAGIPTVMTRGQFDQVLPRLFHDMS
jgi:hypothetical protein